MDQFIKNQKMVLDLLQGDKRPRKTFLFLFSIYYEVIHRRTYCKSHIFIDIPIKEYNRRVFN